MEDTTPVYHYTIIPVYHYTIIPLYHYTIIHVPLYHYTSIPLWIEALHVLNRLCGVSCKQFEYTRVVVICGTFSNKDTLQGHFAIRNAFLVQIE